MLRAFLRAELDSPTEAGRLKRTLSRLSAPEETILGESADTEALYTVFEEYRGREALFDGLNLRELDWYWTDLTLQDLNSRTFTCRNHFEQKYDTRRPAEVASIWNLAHEPNGVMDKVSNGQGLEPPILIGCPDMSRFVILEGHNRLISYLRVPTEVHFPIPAIVGLSKHVSQWCQW